MFRCWRIKSVRRLQPTGLSGSGFCATAAEAGGSSVDNFQTFGSCRTRSDGDDRRVGITPIASFDLMNVREIWRGLKSSIEFEFPTIATKVAVEAFDGGRRRPVSFDFVALAVKS